VLVPANVAAANQVKQPNADAKLTHQVYPIHFFLLTDLTLHILLMACILFVLHDSMSLLLWGGMMQLQDI
jgi:hypothetical protein